MTESIEELEKKIETLPRGTIVTKNIDGKPYFYQQYKENKKIGCVERTYTTNGNTTNRRYPYW